MNKSDADRHTRFVTRLFESHRDHLMRYVSSLLCSHSEAEEVIQETFLRLLSVRHLERNEGRARAYMFRVATNLTHDRFRQRDRRQRRSLHDAAAVTVDGATPELLADMAQSLEIIERTLAELRPRRRRVFLLRVSEGLDYDTIAATLGTSRRTVEREMRHALNAFQQRLKG